MHVTGRVNEKKKQISAKGIGQQLLKKDENANDCCYYLHCATYDYPVTPDPKNDIENAKERNIETGESFPKKYAHSQNKKPNQMKQVN